MRTIILKYLNNECDYEYVEDYIIEYAKKNKKSVNLDYVKARLDDIYTIKWAVGITTIEILVNDLLHYLKVKN